MVDYVAYIQGAAWAAKKQEYAESDRPQECFVCGDPGLEGKDFHHLTYARLGNEDLVDIAPMCPECHSLVHVMRELVPGPSLADVSSAVREAVDVRRAFRNLEERAPNPRKRPSELIADARSRIKPRERNNALASGYDEPEWAVFAHFHVPSYDEIYGAP